MPFEGSIESLGAAYWDVVEAAQFPRTQLRFRNNVVLHQLGMDAQQVSDADLEQAFGRFEGRVPFLALRYHGFQFGNYNPNSAMVGAFCTGSCATAMAIFKTSEPRARERRHGAVLVMDDSP